MSGRLSLSPKTFREHELMGASEVPISISAGSARKETRAWGQTPPKAMGAVTLSHTWE